MSDKKEISLIISDSKVKERYLNFLHTEGKVPLCKNCKKLFDLGFPDSETGVSDNLICHENELICNCEHYNIVKNLFNSPEDGVLDISSYYRYYQQSR